jgi:hypothetical protein
MERSAGGGSCFGSCAQQRAGEAIAVNVAIAVMYADNRKMPICLMISLRENELGPICWPDAK